MCRITKKRQRRETFKYLKKKEGNGCYCRLFGFMGKISFYFFLNYYLIFLETLTKSSKLFQIEISN
jgi:hypothetical protein